ncbi:MAG TPA: exodeoxyribonuclease VII small subunit [Candidatus Thioglobus sp.]|jgi:exodeoxyribonuclease VII small subunit|nr:exodeoxyribonuclease VII small subunit [Candidatus Thioglobus sp.]HIK76845.1 exodeoxyribonuclease VII small subunit [Gammaproteobacteria bacterium]
MTKKFDFNKGLLDLENIVKKMESGELELEESLKLFEHGVELTRKCQSALSSAEQRISILTSDDNYKSSEPFMDDKL